MAAKGSCVFWFLLASAWIVMKSDAADTFESFKELHVDYPKTEAPNDNEYCKKVMGGRGQTKLKANTYIHAPDSELLAACNRKKYKLNHEYGRTSRLPTTLCTYGDRVFLGSSLPGTIKVLCVNGKPVAFRGFNA
uniref:RNase-Ginf1 n=1 Tax=Gerrhonotus infernalis TaxID=310520 RepID=E2E4J5_GERIN|nr:RNase-Ginf1 [Gerrhonotus infernalis]